MLSRSKQLIRRSALCGGLAALLLGPVAVRAQTSAGSSDTAVVKLIQILIQKGILTSGQASSLLAQAQAEAGGAPAAAAHHARRTTAKTTTLPAESTEAAPPPGPPGEVRVTYVPQFVRDQIAAEVRSQVLGEVQSQGWAQPHSLPDWLSRLTFYGDLRLRAESDIQNKGNTSDGLPYPFVDFNSINTGSPFDIGGSALPPLLNTSQNRERFRLRARVGVKAQINNWISADFRLATGTGANPASENITLGQPGEFNEYGIYIDRAYFNFALEPYLRVLAGRTPDPYFISDLMFSHDLNFDGVALQYDQQVADGLGVFFNGGAHPLLDGIANYPSSSLLKIGSHNSYLLAAQAGVRWRFLPTYTATLAAGYFDFSDLSGKESGPCELFTSSDSCSTDDTRPAFSQFGNTMFALRDIVINSSTLSTEPEYFGLASRFAPLDIHGKIDIANYDPLIVTLEGEFVKNLGYNRNFILSRGPVNNVGNNGAFVGGDTAYMARLKVGYPQPSELWQWNVEAGYKYLESDALPDAFDDTDFHLGGTNAKGYLIDAALGIAHNTYIQATWFSAIQVSGPPDGNDVLQIDLNTKF